MEKKCGIYCIENMINGKKYIGQAVDIYSRWTREKNKLRKDEKAWNVYLQNAWKKYGEDNFIFYILEECEECQLDTREMYWISYYHTYIYDSECNGYNITLGGNGIRGIVPWNKGKTMSDEYKQVLSDAHKGYKHTEKQKEKLRDKFLGDKNHQYGKFGFQSSKGSVVYCITLDKFFGSAIDANRTLKNEGIASPDPHSILNCCKNLPKYKSAGRLKDGTKLTWRFATQEEINLIKSNEFNQ